MNAREANSADLEGFGLTPMQAAFMEALLCQVFDVFALDDDRGRHFILLTLTREGTADDGHDVITTNTMTSLDRESLHEYMAEWMRRETQ